MSCVGEQQAPGRPVRRGDGAAGDAVAVAGVGIK
jgi:hypothetical protein